jgi:hypothetical protein
MSSKKKRNSKDGAPAYNRNVQEAVQAFTSKLQASVKSENRAEEISEAVAELINTIKP